MGMVTAPQNHSGQSQIRAYELISGTNFHKIRFLTVSVEDVVNSWQNFRPRKFAEKSAAEKKIISWVWIWVYVHCEPLIFFWIYPKIKRRKTNF